jgi:hypothetical protein
MASDRDSDEMEASLPERLKALPPAPRAELLNVLMLPDFERAETGSASSGATRRVAPGVIGAAYITRGDGNGGGDSNGGGGGGINGPTIDRPGSASVFLSRDSGPGGTTVQVSGEGFAPTERVVISFHTERSAPPLPTGKEGFRTSRSRFQSPSLSLRQHSST